MPVMIRGLIVCQLCVERNRETKGKNKVLMINSHFFSLTTMYYALTVNFSEVFKPFLESFLLAKATFFLGGGGGLVCHFKKWVNPI